jgi:hypothetical protein
MRAGAGPVSGYVLADFVQDGAQQRGRFAIEHPPSAGSERTYASAMRSYFYAS